MNVNNRMDDVVNDEGFTVVGIELRTSNDEAERTIPPFWGRFWQDNVLVQIPRRTSDEVYAVYTNFAHPGIDNEGVYSLVIGARVAGAEVPDGMTSVIIPASRRIRFAVEDNDLAKVGLAWQHIWARTDLPTTYLADYEHYSADGTISILVGVEYEMS